MLQNSDFSSGKGKTFRAKLLIASSEESADIFYASGFHAPDEFCYYETEKEKGIVVSPLEYSRAVSEARKDIRIIDRSQLLKECGPEVPFAVFLSRRLGVTEWQVPARFGLADAQDLLQAGIRLECSRNVPLFPERMCKTRPELAAIRKSVQATEEMMRLLHSMLSEAKVNAGGFLELGGTLLTSEFLRAELEGNFKKMGYSASRTIIAHGPQGAEPHNIGSGPIRKGEPVVADIFPRSDETGYWGDMTRTFVKGKASPVVRKAFNAVLKASEAAKKVLRAGVIASDVHEAACEVLRSSGFQTGRTKEGLPCGFFHGLGHGVGLEIHEAPRVSPLNPKPLRAGNVISVEPGLYYPEWGGIRLEDLAVITRDSWRNFNTMEMELEL